MHHAHQPSNDELFRVAVLLAGDAPSAIALRQRSSDPANVSTLLDALPTQRRPTRVAWATTPLLQAVAALPPMERAALGASALLELDHAAVSSVIAPDAYRSALQQLVPADERALFDLEACQAECIPFRSALLVPPTNQMTASELRGHLALCEACRAANQRWRTAVNEVEDALRLGLRSFTAPIPKPESVQKRPAVPYRRVALAIATVILLIGTVVTPWQRLFSQPILTAQPAATNPEQMVQQALANLYTPSGTGEAWHGIYAVYWEFPDGSYATVHTEQWWNPSAKQERLEVKHSKGGGPYELSVQQGNRTWYRALDNYYVGLSPLVPTRFGSQLVNVRGVDPVAFRQARLSSGAWAVAPNYLKAAMASTVTSLGTQPDAAGNSVQLLSFQARSPIRAADSAPVTVILAIDVATQRLQQIRELAGPANGEQTVVIPWQVVREEWLPADLPLLTETPSTALSVQSSNDLRAPFVEKDGLPANILLLNIPFLAKPPNDLSRVQIFPEDNLIRYSGERGLIEIRSGAAEHSIPLMAMPPSEAAIPFETDMLEGTILFRSFQRTDALLKTRDPNQVEQRAFRIAAYGLTADEILPLLGSVKTAVADDITTLLPLLDWPYATEPEVARTLETAIQTSLKQLEAGAYRERSFFSRRTIDKRYSDPVTLIQNAAFPERVSVREWTIPAYQPDGSEWFTSFDTTPQIGPQVLEPTAFRMTELRNSDGQLISANLSAEPWAWWHSAVYSTTNAYRTDRLPFEPSPEIAQAAYDILKCGGAEVGVASDGSPAIVVETSAWRSPSSCLYARGTAGSGARYRSYIGNLTGSDGVLILRLLLSDDGTTRGSELVMRTNAGETLLKQDVVLTQRTVTQEEIPRKWLTAPPVAEVMSPAPLFSTATSAELPPTVFQFPESITEQLTIRRSDLSSSEGWGGMPLMNSIVVQETITVLKDRAGTVTLYQGPRDTVMRIMAQWGATRTETISQILRIDNESARAWEYMMVGPGVVTLVEANDLALVVPGRLFDNKAFLQQLERVPRE